MEIDQQLRRFFRSETPNPWPDCPVPHARRRLPRITHRIVRYAVAACVGILLIGYLSVAHFFPRDSSMALENQGMIGKKIDHRLNAPR